MKAYEGVTAPVASVQAEDEGARSGLLQRSRQALALTASTLLLSACGAPHINFEHDEHQAGQTEQIPGNGPGTHARPGIETKPDSVTQPIAETDSRHPNVVLILLDDMQLQLLPHMKSVNELLKDRGMTFDNYYDNMTLCCPARASILRGQYAHNTGVKSNNVPNGGFAKFLHSGDEKSTVATWIHDVKNKKGHSIYDTALMGKYMNSFPYNFGKKSVHYVSNHYVPPGWTTFDTPVVGDPYRGTHYKLARTGAVDKHFRDMAKDPKNYLSDTLSRLADRYIADQGSKPFFLYWAPYSPHMPSTVAPRFRHFPVTGPRPEDDPAWSEQNMSDKPKFMHALAKITPAEKKQIDFYWDRRVRAVQSLDENIADMITELKENGTYDNTYIFFTSDNGFHMGQHRLPGGKNTPYNTDIHLPLIVEGPGIKPGSVSHTPVADIDLAPTFAQLTGAKPAYTPDGRSIVPLLHGRTPDNWMPYVETERFDSQSYSSTFDGIDEPADTPAEVGTTSTIPYRGIRNGHWLYVIYRWKAGEDNSDNPTEFYDERKDPYELHNLATEKHLSPYYQKVELRLRKELGHLANCKGAECSHTSHNR
jgi:arylsulfatase A-like enzyme